MKRLLCFLAFAVLCPACHRDSSLEFYTSPAATTPQLPWLYLEKTGALHTLGPVKRIPWRSTTQLQSLMLGGRGDIWLASIETIARARNAGAHVQILAVSGWRKWHLVGRGFNTWRDALAAASLTTCPPGNPAIMMLRSMAKHAGLKLAPERPLEIKQLMLKLLNNTENLALIPEPIASALIAKDHSLKRIAALEDIKTELIGGEPRVPWAAFAINEHSIRKSPELPILLSSMLVNAAQALAKMPPEQAASCWPQEYASTVTTDMLRKSLPNDMLLVIPAHDATSEIQRTLNTIAPDITFDPQLIYTPPVTQP